MFGRSNLNAWLGEFLAEHADAILGSAGFRRRAGARSARRKTGYGVQKIEFFAYSRPAYAPGQAHLVLKAWFYMPEVMQLARQIFGPSFTIDPADPGLAGGVDLDSRRQQEPLGLWLFADQAPQELLPAYPRPRTPAAETAATGKDQASEKVHTLRS